MNILSLTKIAFQIKDQMTEQLSLSKAYIK